MVTITLGIVTGVTLALIALYSKSTKSKIQQLNDDLQYRNHFLQAYADDLNKSFK